MTFFKSMENIKLACLIVVLVCGGAAAIAATSTLIVLVLGWAVRKITVPQVIVSSTTSNGQMKMTPWSEPEAPARVIQQVKHPERREPQAQVHRPVPPPAPVVAHKPEKPMMEITCDSCQATFSATPIRSQMSENQSVVVFNCPECGEIGIPAERFQNQG